MFFQDTLYVHICRSGNNDGRKKFWKFREGSYIKYSRGGKDGIPELKRDDGRWSAFQKRKRDKKGAEKAQAIAGSLHLRVFWPAAQGPMKFPEILCPGIFAGCALRRANVALYPSFLIRVLYPRSVLFFFAREPSLSLSFLPLGLFLVI